MGHSENPEVKFSLLNEQGICQVLLNDELSLLSLILSSCALNEILDKIQIIKDLDPPPPVAVLSRFHDPYACPLLLEQFMETSCESHPTIVACDVMC